MNIAVTGATGAMGRAIMEAATDRDEITIALAVNRSPNVDRIAGTRIRPAGELPDLLVEYRPNVLIDFTGPESAVRYARWAADAAVPIVTGTTGFDSSQLDTLRDLSQSVPVLRASNFARGIHALLSAVTEALSALPGYDIELLETHHNRKQDAPSGTAKTILDRIEHVRGDLEAIHGRVGTHQRQPGEIGVHARRAGDVRGEHEVLIAGNDELLTIEHRAESRSVFAHGALDAAVWLAGQPPGWYEFADVLES